MIDSMLTMLKACCSCHNKYLRCIIWVVYCKVTEVQTWQAETDNGCRVRRIHALWAFIAGAMHFFKVIYCDEWNDYWIIFASVTVSSLGEGRNRKIIWLECLKSTFLLVANPVTCKQKCCNAKQWKQVLIFLTTNFSAKFVRPLIYTFKDLE